MIAESETVSLWELVTMLVVVLAPPIVVLFTHDKMGQKPYALRFAAALVLWLILIPVGAFAVEVWLVITVLYVFIIRWTAMRLNDLQSTRWYALLWYIGPVGTIFSIVLSVKKHRSDRVLF